MTRSIGVESGRYVGATESIHLKTRPTLLRALTHHPPVWCQVFAAGDAAVLRRQLSLPPSTPPHMATGDAAAATRGLTGHVGAAAVAAARRRSPSKSSQRPGTASLDPKLRWTANDVDEDEHRADDAGTKGDPVEEDADAAVVAPHRLHGELISTTPWNPL